MKNFFQLIYLMKPGTEIRLPIGRVIRLALCMLILTFGVALASATISSFTGTYTNGVVVIRWRTSEEVDNQGFYVQRSQYSDSGFTSISPIIASNLTVSGTNYTYTDSLLIPGVIYYYRLEALSNNGFSEYSSPIAVTVPLLTATPTATGLAGTATMTTSPRPPTPTSRTPTAPAFTATPTSTPLPTETPTLVPLPSITLLFPVPTEVRTPTPSPTAPGGPLSVAAGTTPPSNTSTYLLGGIIVVIWILLGIFLYLYIKRLGY